MKHVNSGLWFRWLAAFAVTAALFLCDRSSGQSSKWLEIQTSRWQKAEIRPEWQPRVAAALERFKRDKRRYEAIEKMRRNGVPAIVVFCLHGRESGWDFTKHLHEGSPLTHRTRYVPKGRLPDTPPPYTFEQSAEDALYRLKDLENRVKWSSLPDALLAIELYNGAGYLKYHPSVPSPYLWSGTTVYIRGKFVSDGRYDPYAVDKQIGCAAILKAAGLK